MMDPVFVVAGRLFERRAHRRVAVEVSARCSLEASEDEVGCQVENVSEGGMCIRLPRTWPVEPGAYLMVELPVPHGTGRLATRTRVENLSDTDGLRAHLRFLDRSPVFRRTISDAKTAWASN